VANASVIEVVRSMIVSRRSFAQRLEAALGLNLPLLAFELERLGDDGDSERAELAGEARDHRCRAGAGAAAQTGGDEDHVGAVERLDDLVGVFERRLPADVRIGAGTQPLGQLAADLQLDGGGVGVERLAIGVRDDELDAVESGLHHPVDGVAAAAADPDHLDPGAGAALFVEPQSQPLNLFTDVGVIVHSSLLYGEGREPFPRKTP
jgi:hypothetical protein